MRSGIFGLWLIALVACDGPSKDADDTDLPDDTDESDAVETDDSDPVEESDLPDDTDTIVDSDLPDDTDVPSDDTDVPSDDTDTLVPPDDTDTLIPPDDTDLPSDDTDTVLPPDDTDVAVDSAPPPADTALDTSLPFTDPIIAIQTGLTPPGTRVELDELVVTAVLRDGVYVGQRDGGEHSGIFVYAAPQIAATLYIDALVALAGDVEEVASPNGSLTRINVTVPGGYLADYLSAPGPIPGTLTVRELQDPAVAEAWESTLIRVRNARVWSESSNAGFEIGDANTRLWVSVAGYWPGQLYYGDRVGELWGILTWQNDRFELLPRRAGDYQTLLTLQAPAESFTGGEVAISEWMTMPAASATGACTPATGQYVEVVNTTGGAIDLDGLLLYSYDTNVTWQLRQATPLSAGGRATLFSAGAANCYGLAAGAGYGFVSPTPALGLGLFNHSVLLDDLSAVGGLGASGAAIELSESHLDAADNDQPANWCVATTPISGGAGDRGTPGRVNACP